MSSSTRFSVTGLRTPDLRRTGENDADEEAENESDQVTQNLMEKYEAAQGHLQFQLPISASIPRSQRSGSYAFGIGLPNSQANLKLTYVQLNVLNEIGREWKQSARWIKYEEDEEVGRWSRPKIPTLSYYSLQSLQKFLQNGVILLDIDEIELTGIVFSVIEEITLRGLGSFPNKEGLLELFSLNHKITVPVSAGRKDSWVRRRFSVATGTGRSDSAQLNPSEIERLHKLSPGADARRQSTISWKGDAHQPLAPTQRGSISQQPSAGAPWTQRRKSTVQKIVGEADGTLVLVGKSKLITSTPITGFVRLREAIYLGEITELEVPIKFVIILLGPEGIDELEYREIGRSVSTLMANLPFQGNALKAKLPETIIQGIEDFLQNCTVIPPGDWDPQCFPYEELREPKKIIRQQLQRKKSIVSTIASFQLGADGEEAPIDKLYPGPAESLKRTNKLFGGLIRDAKRRYKFYTSDFKDGLNSQCLATIIFLYFGCAAGNIAFGGLMGKKTENYIGISETLVGASVGGIIFALFSAQSLLIVGTTGPLMIFDESLYQFCKGNHMSGSEFLIIRTWIGIWMCVIGLVFVAFEGSSLIKWCTRFTQEIFSTLISLVFIWESINSLIHVFQEHPLKSFYVFNGSSSSGCGQDENLDFLETESNEQQHIEKPNVALLCTILMFGTYATAYFLKNFRSSGYLNEFTRDCLSNFAVLLAIVSMGCLDYYFKDTETQKLSLPDSSEGLKNSLENRTWIINPFEQNEYIGNMDPFGNWIILASVLPAILLFILIFMESSISELIVTRNELKLRKGGGFHVDILLICCTNMLSGYLGTGWLAAPTIRSAVHATSLTIYSKNNPPGEKPYITGVHEQRLTSLIVSILIGCSIFMSELLKFVPMAVLFGVFLYMGLTSLSGVQFVERISLLCKQPEYYPNVSYVTRIHRWKMHIFTLIQLGCLALLWAVKESPIALTLALLILLLVPLRFFVLPRFFKDYELRTLDSDDAAENDNGLKEDDD